MHTNDDFPLHEITFADFMQLALYHPKWGYYMSTLRDIGAQGDFTTAPEISPLFAYCFAEQVKHVISALGSQASILELGAGTGRFAYDLLDQLDRLQSLPTHYFILEPSPVLRALQEKRLAQSGKAWANRVVWLASLPEQMEGVIIANEVLDALPVHRVQWQDNADPQEYYVLRENEGFAWRLGTISSDVLLKQAIFLQDQYALGGGYSSEISLQVPVLIRSLASCLTRGMILLADYGYGQREYYHPQRSSGTLTCFYQHRRHDNPLINPGKQDITAHVNFTQVIETAAECGLELAGFTTQCGFLLGSGLMTLAGELEKTLSTVDSFALHQAIKTLTLPTEMGERIKIMGLAKNYAAPVAAFQLQNRERDLDT